MAGQSYTAYAILDVERIHDFILETGRLRDIRGASALLLDIEQALKPLVAAYEGSPVYIAGGIALARFPGECYAKAFIEAAKERYRAVSQGAASAATAWGPRTGNALADYYELHRRLRLYKEERRTEDSSPQTYASTIAVHSPHCKLCTRCGLRPAVEIMWDSDEKRDEFLCAPCKEKTTLGRKTGRQGLPVEQKLLNDLKATWSYESDIKAPKEFGDFSKKEWCSKRIRESSFMALLLADGNGMGDYIERLISNWCEAGKSQDDIDLGLGKFSTALDKALKGAWAEAVKRVYSNSDCQERLKSNGHFIPLRILLCGGDDLLAVVEAGRALELAREFVKVFEEKTKGAKDELGTQACDPLTISVAVVLGKVNYPFTYFYDLAHTLLRTAKGWGRMAVQQSSSSIRPASMFHLGIIRSTAPEMEQGTEQALGLPAMRPFSRDEFARLIDKGLAQVEKTKVPHSKLKDLAGALREDAKRRGQVANPRPPTWAYDLWRAHLREDERDSFDKMVKALAGADLAYPWVERGAGPDSTRWVTPLADLLELMDFWGE